MSKHKKVKSFHRSDKIENPAAEILIYHKSCFLTKERFRVQKWLDEHKVIYSITLQKYWSPLVNGIVCEQYWYQFRNKDKAVLFKLTFCDDLIFG